jgi:hypothetical protein
MKIVVNSDFGGFGLSHEALELLAKKKGKQLYWFDITDIDSIEPISGSPKDEHLFVLAYTVPNPNLDDNDWDSVFDEDDISRSDVDLVSTVEELGNKANGRSARLRIVEVPDDVEWIIENYDGREHIAEVHRTWY